MLTEAGRIALEHAETIFRTAERICRPRCVNAVRCGARCASALWQHYHDNFQMQFLEPLVGRSDVEVILRSGNQADLLRGLDAMAYDVVLTNLAPAARCGQPVARAASGLANPSA